MRKKARSDLKRIPDHEFYVALADKNIKGMQEALDKLLELSLLNEQQKIQFYILIFTCNRKF